MSTECKGLQITDSAQKRIESSRKNEEQCLRISISGGGCHGYSYSFSWDQNITDQDAVYYDMENKKKIVIMNEKFKPIIGDATLDFIVTLSASYFSIKSSNFETSCGCGTSFSLKIT